MAKIVRRQVIALVPKHAHVSCAFCAVVTRWDKRPDLVYRGSHRYARWVCSACGRTSERVNTYKDEAAKTRAALVAGPGTHAWSEYAKLETYV